MSNFVIPILGFATLPDASGNVFAESSAIVLSNDRYPGLVFSFNDTATRIGLGGIFRIPENYVGTPKILIEWSSTATTNNVVWDFDYTAIAVDESFDPSTDQQSATVTDAAPGSSLLRQSAEIALTAANFAVGDMVEFSLFRDGTDGADTMAAKAVVFGVFFKYADA